MGTSHSRHAQYERQKQRIHGKSMSANSRRAHTMYNGPVSSSSNGRMSFDSRQPNGTAKTMPSHEYYNNQQANRYYSNNGMASHNQVNVHHNFNRTRSESKLPTRHDNKQKHRSGVSGNSSREYHNNGWQNRVRNTTLSSSIYANDNKTKGGGKGESEQFVINVNAPSQQPNQYYSKQSTRQTKRQFVIMQGNGNYSNEPIMKSGGTLNHNQYAINTSAQGATRKTHKHDQYQIPIIEKVKTVNSILTRQSAYYRNPYSNEHGSIY